MNALEPDSNVGDKRNASSELCTDLSLVDVVSQAVRNDVVRKVLHIILGAGLSASARVSGDTKDGGLSTEVGNERSNADLGSSSIATGVGDTSGLSDLTTVDQLRKTVSPLVIEAVVGAQVDNDVARLRALVDSIHERLADTVRKSHDPAVHITVRRHALHIFGAQILVNDLTLVITLQLLASQLARRNMAEIHVGVSIEKVDQGLASVATGSNKSNLGGPVVGHVFLSQWRVGIRGGVGSHHAGRHSGTSEASGPQSISGGGECALLLD